MITAALISSRQPWVGELRSALASYAAVFELDMDTPVDVGLARLPVDLIVVLAEPVTEQVIELVGRLRELHPDSLVVCAASAETMERARADELVKPDFWLVAPVSAAELHAQLAPILTLIQTGGSPPQGAQDRQPRADAVERPRPADRNEPLGGWDNSLYRVVRQLSGTKGLDELFTAFCDAVQEATTCVSYCLLWKNADSPHLRVVRSEGLAPLLQEECVLHAEDPLPACLQRSRAILTRESLMQTPQGARALRELEMVGGVMAVPMFSQGLLRGILVVGPKALGDPYTSREAAGLFMLSSAAAAAASQTELHEELEDRNRYIAEVLSTMESGVITLDSHGRVRVCNPYAARVLRLDREALLGQNVRALPAPLGDYLYECLVDGKERSAEELSVLGNSVVVRVSTRRLLDVRGVLMGSMLLLEDVTAERALMEERRKA
ncbi:MAG: PAS domain-containing protein, partial [Armatimonadetes bacterium]|nr:PAS domain-containing protein [Armatimonadota bacterium]